MQKSITLNTQELKLLTKQLTTFKTLFPNNSDTPTVENILAKLKFDFYFDPETIKDHVGVPLADKWNFVHDNCDWDSMEDFHNLLWDFLLQVEAFKL